MKRLILGLLFAGLFPSYVYAQPRLAPPKVTTLTGLNGNQGDIVNLVGTGDYICTTTTCTSAGNWKQITTGAATLTTPISLANGGTAAALVDPNADRILFWDDSAGAFTFLTLGTGLSITTTTINAAVTAPAGATGTIQYNNSGAFGGITGSSVSGADVTLGGSISVVTGVLSPSGTDGDVDNPGTPGTALTVTAGSGGDGNDDTGVGGAVTIQSGAGGAGLSADSGIDGSVGGDISILAGNGGNGAAAGPSLGGVGGSILVQAGDSGEGNNEHASFGGDLTIRTGASTTNGVGDAAGRRSGRLLLETNAPADGGDAGGVGGDSGDIRLFTASGGASPTESGGISGQILLQTGPGGAGAVAGAAGIVSLTGGNGGVPSGNEYGGNGGDVLLTGGNGGLGRGGGFTGGTGGSVSLIAGALGSGTGGATVGTPGDIRLDVETNPGGTIRAFGPFVSDHSLTVTEVAFASLPSSPAVGALANVSDSNTATWGANVAAGGANHILARWNGSNWTVVGK